MRFLQVLATICLVFGVSGAQASGARWMPWPINWTLSDAENELVMPMICDDAYYAGLHAVVFGVEGVDFSIELSSTDTGSDVCKIIKKSTRTRNQVKSSVLRIENKGQCDITIRQLINGVPTTRQAQAFLSDAC